jgi:hypothetical protein
LFPRIRQARKRRCRYRFSWLVFLSIEPLERRLMLEGMNLLGPDPHANGQDTGHDAPAAYIGNIESSAPQDLKVDPIPNTSDSASDPTSPAAPGLETSGPSDSSPIADATGDPQSNVAPSPGDQQSATLSATPHLSTPDITGVDADAATLHFAQLGSDTSPPAGSENTLPEASFSQQASQGANTSSPLVGSATRDVRPANAIGQSLPELTSFAAQPQGIKLSTAPGVGPSINAPQTIGEQTAAAGPPASVASTEPHTQTSAGSSTGSTDPVRTDRQVAAGVAAANIQSPWISGTVGDAADRIVNAPLIPNPDLLNGIDAAATPQTSPAEAIPARSLAAQSNFVDMIFASVGKDTAKGLKSLSEEPLDPWILRGVVIRPAIAAAGDEGLPRSTSSSQTGSRPTKADRR